ncbi:MAG TPA: putative zinc-binding metallopeptidase [Solirubrobacteraceae bacterium]|nr:putative zinc-binding metallopeptidase [Solirubrobacteraceae bacterium]
MRAFTCDTCGQLLFFENSRCLRCNSRLGLVPSRLDIVVLDEPAHSTLRPCANAELAQCNWVLEEGDPGPLCLSCRLTRTRPADSDADGLAAFAKAEGAKRRLIFQLLDLGLPIGDDLAFDLLSSRTGPVVTGHSDGVITIDLAESDDARREQRRTALGEPYRTILGHFRHEIGHYYWPVLVQRRAGELERARALFGDDRVDYESTLQRHYRDGPAPDWSERHVSAYATMHPWEDWAETFAHYLHIRDTLETAAAFGLVVAGPDGSEDGLLSSVPVTEAGDRPFEAIIADWLPLTYALNAINRSMGHEDLYPFTLAPTVIDKLAFVHQRVRAAVRQARMPATP